MSNTRVNAFSLYPRPFNNDSHRYRQTDRYIDRHIVQSHLINNTIQDKIMLNKIAHTHTDIYIYIIHNVSRLYLEVGI